MYIRDKNPAGKLPGVGWGPNMRGLGAYRPSANPSSRKPGDLRGLGCSGNCSGCTKKLGCVGLRGLGQDIADQTDLSEGYTPSAATSIDVAEGYSPPVGSPGVVPTVYSSTPYGYGPSPEGGVTYYPPGAGNVGPYATPGSLSTSSLTSSLPSIFGTGITSTVPASSSSEWLWIIGGVGALALILSLGGKRR